MTDTRFEPGGGSYWQQQVEAAELAGNRQITITGNWEIERTIYVPSDFTVFLEACHLRMADNTFCNMFCNKHIHDPKGRTIEGCDRNIRIIGRGNVILDGGTYNDLSERNWKEKGRHISVNSVILFANVEQFTVSDIHIRNQRYWAMNFVHCRYGAIRHIDFCADDGIRGADGLRVPGKTLRDRDCLSKPEECGTYPFVRNADGIDLRVGCHDILIEDITGFTEDDTVALTGLDGSVEKLYSVEGLSRDIHNVIIRNVNSAAYCCNVRLLNRGGIKLYNILVDGVMDASEENVHMDRGINALRMGDEDFFKDVPPTPEDTYNITVRNVYSRAYWAVSLAGSFKNLVVDNICGYGGNEVLIENNNALLIDSSVQN